MLPPLSSCCPSCGNTRTSPPTPGASALSPCLSCLLYALLARDSTSSWWPAFISPINSTLDPYPPSTS
jgi:hypothetical protein